MPLVVPSRCRGRRAGGSPIRPVRGCVAQDDTERRFAATRRDPVFPGPGLPPNKIINKFYFVFFYLCRRIDCFVDTNKTIAEVAIILIC